MDRSNPRAGSSSARDNNPRTVRHVSQAAQVRETRQHSQVAQRRAEPSSGEIDPSTHLETHVTPLSLAAQVALKITVTTFLAERDVQANRPCRASTYSVWQSPTHNGVGVGVGVGGVLLCWHCWRSRAKCTSAAGTPAPRVCPPAPPGSCVTPFSTGSFLDVPSVFATAWDQLEPVPQCEQGVALRTNC